MTYLIDTHALIWFFSDPLRLSEVAYNLIENRNTRCSISKTSLFEIAIKSNIGKLNFNLSIEQIENTLISLGINVLQLDSKYLDYLINLPQFPDHKDPFDRLIISTAAVDNLKIITKDEKFNLYQNIVETVW